MASVKEALQQLVAGKISAEEAGKIVAKEVNSAPEHRDPMEIAKHMVYGDPEPDDNDWIMVEFQKDRKKITEAQYQTIYKSVFG